MAAVARGASTVAALTELSRTSGWGTRPARPAIAFGRDGMLYMTTTADFQIPNDRRTRNSQRRQGAAAQGRRQYSERQPVRRAARLQAGGVYARPPQLAGAWPCNPGTGEMWLNENGPNGGDEINILKPGANYGWPVVSYGRTYPGLVAVDVLGTKASSRRSCAGCRRLRFREWRSTPGDTLPKWKGDVFVGALRTGEIPGTGHLERILFNEKMEELRRESLLTGLRQRMR